MRIKEKQVEELQASNSAL